MLSVNKCDIYDNAKWKLKKRNSRKVKVVK